MIYKNKPECKTVGTWIPVETYETLLKMANDRTQREKKWTSLSKLIRDILMDAAAEEEQHAEIRDCILKAMECHETKEES